MERVIVIGGGPAGYPLALSLARAGHPVTLVEREHVGGTCLNWGCIPTKALLASSQLLQKMRHATAFGLRAEAVTSDWPAIQARKDKVVAQLRGGIEGALKKAGVTLVRGEARLRPGRRVEVAAAGFAQDAGRVVLATGSQPALPPFVPGDRQIFWTSEQALSATAVPETLLVIGGGVIGLEMGQLFADLGSRVTVVEMLPQLLPGLDGATARRLLPEFKKSFAEILLGQKVEALRAEGGAAVATLAGQERRFARVLIATGRRPNLAVLEGGPDLRREQGALAVDGRFATSEPGVFALGDLIPGPMLAHKATYDAQVLAAQWAGEDVRPDYGFVPSCVYTHPEVAWCGLSEEAATAGGQTVSCGRAQYGANGKALCAGEGAGQIKVILGEHGKLLGAVLWGPEVANLVAEAVVLGTEGSDLRRLWQAIHPHPTLAEALAEAVAAATGRGGHG